ncbi:unnamed protein product [Rotaria sordida]|uniref:Reverse transcriptase domain-containing protein n=1 Tax=Rotaria sordida TaxID=392033 RepID=A0A815H625_9BILA|nr:unnamed protein product [Rotaria sordida]
MEKTQAYQCLGINDPLFELIQRTNKYLLDLRLAKWITQKQYELLSIKPNEVELAHLYYLPKAHKPGTPLRPIISGLKHPTIKISKFLDDLLRPLFDKMAQETTVTSGFELVKKLQKWSILNMNGNTILCTIDVVDLYTMIPQVEGVLSLKKMLDYLKLKKVGNLKIETIIRLSRFVMQNNYFSYDGQFYHQSKGGAMGSPLTLTMANCYMFFFERQIAKQIKNSGGLYFRYIDDLFIVINWPVRHLLKQIDKWKNFDENIKLNPNINTFATFLDLYMENRDGVLFTTVYQKPSYEPYYLPFNSIHPLHMKKNIPFTMLLRVIRYCSTFQTYLDEREKLRMALLFNKYPNKLIEEQFNNVLLKCNIDQPLTNFNYDKYRQEVMNSPIKEKATIDYEAVIGNQFYNQNGGNRFNYQRYPRNYYRRNIFYNRNYRIPRQFFNPYETGGYGFVNPRQQRQGRSVQPVRSSSRRRPSNRPRRRGPRQIRLNDFMPTELRESSPNLPSEFNIATTTAPITTAPITTTVTTNATTDALPQREIFARRNTTQPFTVNENYQNQRVQQQQGNQRQRKTTSSFRRRQRRNNRFAVLADENENDNISDVEVEMNDESMPLNANKKQRTDKNKTFGGY